MLFGNAGRAQIRISGAGTEPWREALQRAVNFSQRAEYHRAVRSHQKLLSTLPISSNVELRAYVLSQMADADIELGEYVEAETRAREALQGLAAGGTAHTGTFAIAERVLAMHSGLNAITPKRRR